MKAVMTPNKAFTNSADSRARRRPTLSLKLPQIIAPIIMPMNVMAAARWRNVGLLFSLHLAKEDWWGSDSSCLWNLSVRIAYSNASETDRLRVFFNTETQHYAIFFSLFVIHLLYGKKNLSIHSKPVTKTHFVYINKTENVSENWRTRPAASLTEPAFVSPGHTKLHLSWRDHIRYYEELDSVSSETEACDHEKKPLEGPCASLKGGDSVMETGTTVRGAWR